MKGKKIVSTLLALLLLASLPVSALAAEWDIGKGDITVNAGSGGQTVTQGSQVDVPDDAPVITGSSDEHSVTINAEKDQTANVTLSGVNIDTSTEDKAAVSTNGEGNVSIELDGENTLKSDEGHAGLEKNNGGKLTIADKDKNGKLTAEGGKYGAGIGGGDDGSGRDIEITGGKVTASSKSDGAGIGGGNSGDGENITISGGEVTATGGSDEEGLSSGYGAGIGGGYTGDGRNIKITGGKVTASSKNAGAGIGGGDEGNGEDITITGGEVKASSENVGAGIGGGYKGDGKRIKITDGTVDAASDKGAGIGGGDDGNGENIAISGGKVTAKSSKNGAGIGGGMWGKGKDITVSGDAQLKVQGGVGNYFDGPGAGIGDGGSRPKGSTGGSPIPGAEVGPDTSGLTTNGSIEYYAPGADMEKDKPTSTTTGKPTEPIEPAVPEQPEAERGMDAPLYFITDRDGRAVRCRAERKGGVLTVTVDEDFAVLTSSLSGMTALRAQGIEKIIFVTNGAKTAVKLSTIISKLTANGVFRLTHDGKAVTFTLG